MSHAHGDQRRRWPVWAARCLWGLVVAALLIHLIPGQGYRSATSVGGLSQLFVTAAVMTFLFAFATVGALVASRVPANPVGWLLLGSALAYTLATAATGLPAPRASAPAWYTADADLAGQPLYTAGLALGFLTLLLFPTGSLPSRRWRWAGWLIGAGWLLFTIGQTLGPARLPDLPAPNPAAVGGSAGRVLSLLQVGQVLAIAGGVLACISLIVRFRRSQSVVRKQIEWLAYAAAVVAAGIIVSALVQLRPQTETLDNYTNGIVSLALASIPVAMGIAILTRRLYDIDVIVNKTVVYLSLAAFITAVYIALVVGIGQAVGQQGKAGFGLSVLATAVVAVAFQPVRERVQRLANRLVYGKRATPYEALSAFADQIGATVPAGELLPHLARMLAEATGAARTQVWLTDGGRLRLEAAYPAANADDAERSGVAIALPRQGLPEFPGVTRAFEVSHAGEPLGALTLAKRPGRGQARRPARRPGRAGAAQRAAGRSAEGPDGRAPRLQEADRRGLRRRAAAAGAQHPRRRAAAAGRAVGDDAPGRDHRGQRPGGRTGHGRPGPGGRRRRAGEPA